jgi:hypothetical protein
MGRRIGWTLVLLAFIVVALLGCASPPPLSGGTNDNTNASPAINGNTGDSGQLRPDIPRVNPPSDTPDNPQYESSGEQQHGKPPVILVNVSPSVDLDVPLGDTIGKQHPLITRSEFPLLRHSPIRVSGNLLVGYEETLRFDFGNDSTGTLAVGKDQDELGTFVRFERDKPVFEYRVTLDRGNFSELQGREIQLLGSTYLIAEVTNYSVSLFGKDVESNLFFNNGDELEVNSSAQRSTRCNVTPKSIAYTLYARGHDDNKSILLSPGESLAQNMGQLAMASLVFNIRYKGNPAQNATLLTFTQDKYGYRLELVTFKGKMLIPLVEQDAGRLVLGETDAPLRVTPCPADLPYCVAPETWLVLTSGDGRTFIVRYNSAHQHPNNIVFSDRNSNRYEYEYAGSPGAANGTVDIRLEDVMFRARIGPRDNATGGYNISVDQGFRNGVAEIVSEDGVVVRLGNITGATLPLEILLPWRANDKPEERWRFNITYDPVRSAWSMSAANLTFYDDEETYDTFAATPYGMLVWLTRDDNVLPLNIGKDAQLLVPRSQLHGTVSLEG